MVVSSLSAMNSEKVSVLILSWRRPDQVKAIVETEAAYESVAEVIVFNNNPAAPFMHSHPKVRVLNSTFDFGLRSRWAMAFLAWSECLIFQDDDILLPEQVFHTFLAEILADPERAYSLHGRNPDAANRYNAKNVYGEAAIVLTRATAIHKRVLPALIEAEHAFFRPESAYPVGREFPAEDIFLSYCLSRVFGKKPKALNLPHKNLSSPHAISATRPYLRTRIRLMHRIQSFFSSYTAGQDHPPSPDSLPTTVPDQAAKPPVEGQPSTASPPPPPPGVETGPKKIRLTCKLSPGDIMMLTAAVRDLHLSHPGKFLTAVESPAPDLWENNPYVTKLPADAPDVQVLETHYPLVHQSNEGAYHFIHGYRLFLEEALGVRIKATKFWGDIHFRPEEFQWISMIHEHFTGWDTPFWVITTGGKMDYTAKWWIPEYAQEVVDHFKDRIQFVQIGSTGDNHHHPILKGVINLVGQTSLRQLMRLIYHAQGVICPVTFAMHLAAATPPKPGFPKRKPCVVTAGGREPSVWEMYTHHAFLHTNGQMPCCDNGGCWKSRTVALHDGSEHDRNLCVNTAEFNGRKLQRCMRDFVGAPDVIRAVERYYLGGVLHYLPPGHKTIHAEWEDRITNRAHLFVPAARRPANGAQNDRPLHIAIIASGVQYQAAAALAAATYRVQMKESAVVSVYVPEEEALQTQLSQPSARYGFAVKRFSLKLVSQRKFTSQLKCQGFMRALLDLPEDRLLLIADADTYCLKPVRIDESVEAPLREGKIGLVPDVMDRHESNPDRPWFVPKEKRTRYVNSGVIFASKQARPLFEKFASLANDPTYLDGPFNDQNIINFALGQFFRDRLVLLEPRFNAMAKYLNVDSVIGHCAGGAGRIEQRCEKHRKECLRILDLSPEAVENHPVPNPPCCLK